MDVSKNETRMFMKMSLLPILLAALLPFATTSRGGEKFKSPADVVGKPMPALDVQFIGEKPAYEGKPRIVEFWATWCPPCRASIPHLNEIYKKHKAKGLVVIGITDEEKDKVEAFQKKVPMDYAVGIDAKGALLQQLGIEGIPHAFLIDKAGNVVWQGHPMELADAEIEKVLK
jgi:thiol-disulfide isomerase/thioredoxin